MHAGYDHNNYIFRMFSQSKPVTAAATMILVDDGAIGLDDPVVSGFGVVVLQGGLVDRFRNRRRARARARVCV